MCRLQENDITNGQFGGIMNLHEQRDKGSDII